jgi:hypothetical protein
LKILDLFTTDINIDDDNDNIKKINAQLQERKIDADDIIKIDYILIHDKVIRYYIIYKKELKTYDSDPRMR